MNFKGFAPFLVAGPVFQMNTKHKHHEILS